MSYNAYITRGKFWAEDQGQEVAAEEWLGIIRTDAELVHNERNGPYFAVLKEADRCDDSWLDWSDGNIYTSYPKPALQRKMLQIADRLEAHIQGDDGEIYDSVDDFPKSVKLPEGKTAGAEQLPPYKRRDMLWELITFVTIGAVIITAIVFDLW